MAEVNGKSLKSISWENFVRICVLERLSKMRRGATVQELGDVNIKDYQFLLARYNLRINERKSIVTQQDAHGALLSLWGEDLVELASASENRWHVMPKGTRLISSDITSIIR